MAAIEGGISTNPGGSHDASPHPLRPATWPRLLGSPPLCPPPGVASRCFARNDGYTRDHSPWGALKGVV